MALSDINLNFEKIRYTDYSGERCRQSTLLNIVTAQIFPSNGVVKIFGETPYEMTEH